MLSVSPSNYMSSFEERYIDYKSYYGEGKDAVLGPGWDLAPLRSESDSSQSSSSSSSPPQIQSNGTSLGLLIRSKYQGWERSFELHHDWPVPNIEMPDEILIRNVSVGLNPVDFKRCVIRTKDEV
jgi:hypothetical protein